MTSRKRRINSVAWVVSATKITRPPDGSGCTTTVAVPHGDSPDRDGIGQPGDGGGQPGGIGGNGGQPGGGDGNGGSTVSPLIESSRMPLSPCVLPSVVMSSARIPPPLSSDTSRSGGVFASARAAVQIILSSTSRCVCTRTSASTVMPSATKSTKSNPNPMRATRHRSDGVAVWGNAGLG